MTFISESILDRKRIKFIVNPFSVWSGNEGLHKLIKEHLDHDKYDYEYQETEYKGHAIELSALAVKDDFDIIVACGGDGTVNEVAQSLVNTDKVLGIIPAGSGNGFAMYIGLGRNSKKAIQILNEAEPRRIDSCKVNEKFFLNLAGVGFDALIAYKADSGKKRGLQMYLGMISKEMIKFKAEHFKVEIDDGTIEGKFTTIAVANAAMYGYNFTVAPSADLSDGLMDVVFVHKAPLLRTLSASWRMLNNSLNKSKLVSVKRSKKVVISTENPYYLHLDGESFSFERPLRFEIIPDSINVLFPAKQPAEDLK
ncbi:MAG: diacylglycerol kinase family lipid kinase [Bacteroidia bacterium]|nr:diacylglycerol kinase family lipid kinase [Bacteroidia bacterium]